jgi:hypothetical protein
MPPRRLYFRQCQPTRAHQPGPAARPRQRASCPCQAASQYAPLCAPCARACTSQALLPGRASTPAALARPPRSMRPHEPRTRACTSQALLPGRASAQDAPARPPRRMRPYVPARARAHEPGPVARPRQRASCHCQAMLPRAHSCAPHTRRACTRTSQAMLPRAQARALPLRAHGRAWFPSEHTDVRGSLKSARARGSLKSAWACAVPLRPQGCAVPLRTHERMRFP